MASLSDYMEAGLLNVLRGTAFPLAATGSVYVSLHTTATTDAGGGTELAGNGYARQAVTKVVGSWSAPGVGGAMTNSAVVTFGPNTTVDWGTVTHMAIWDALTVGNMLFHGALTASKAVAVGDSLSFAIGAVSITAA